MCYSEQKLDPNYDYSMLQLKQEREQKQEHLKSLERKYHYNIKLLQRRKKQKLSEAQKQKQRQDFQHHQRLFSDHLFKMKKENQILQKKKKRALKKSIQVHRQQKSQLMLGLREQIINAAKFHRYQKSLYHHEINRNKLQAFRNNKRLYNKERHNQHIRKIRQEQRLTSSRQKSTNMKSQRFMTQWEKIEQIDDEYHQKRADFAVGLRKAINQYNRVAMS